MFITIDRDNENLSKKYIKMATPCRFHSYEVKDCKGCPVHRSCRTEGAS